MFIPALLLVFVQAASASGTGVCGIEGKVTKLSRKQPKNVTIQIQKAWEIEGDGKCQHLVNEIITVDRGPRQKRAKFGQKLQFKATCYHNMTPTSGVHDCYKWAPLKN